jgi:hypothetical protein
VSEHERESPGVEQDSTEAGINNAFQHDVDGLSSPGEAGFKKHEPSLHEEHEEGRNQYPQRVDGFTKGGVGAGVDAGAGEAAGVGAGLTAGDTLATGDAVVSATVGEAVCA